MVCSLFLSVPFFLLVVSSSLQDEITNKDIVFAEVQSCKGCQLRGLPEVKSFIFDDVPLYGEKVVFKEKHGAPPELILYDENRSELKRIALRDYTRRGCNELMEQYGFKKQKKNEL